MTGEKKRMQPHALSLVTTHVLLFPVRCSIAQKLNLLLGQPSFFHVRGVDSVFVRPERVLHSMLAASGGHQFDLMMR